jgi:hypothetical protein
MEKKMNRKTVKSSNINSIGYNVEKQILEVEFCGGSVYHYKDVGLLEVVKFIFAESFGNYFAKNIKSKYQYVKGEYNV